MKLTIKQKILAVIATLLIVLIITNPSIQAFKEYIGSSTYEGLHRERNFFVASVYRFNHREYVGFVGNFIAEGYQHVSAMPDTVIDTTKHYDEYGILIRKKN